MSIITVDNQEKLNAIQDDFQGEIHIIGSIELISKYYKNANIIVLGNAQVIGVFGNAQVRGVYGNAQVRGVYGNAQVIGVHGNAQVLSVYDNAQVIGVHGNAQVRGVYDNAQVIGVSDNAQVVDVSDNAQVVDVSDNAQVNGVSGNAQVLSVYGNAQVLNVSDNAQVRGVSGNAQVLSVYGNAQVHRVYDNAQVENIYDNAQVVDVYGNAQVRGVYGNAMIIKCSGSSTIQTFGQNIINLNRKEKDVKIYPSENTTIVWFDDIEPTFDSYRKLYPVKVVDGQAILYKSVHKTEDGKYISNYDMKYEYRIGETNTHECNKDIKESCTTGLHVSHKMWAINFGTSWKNMAILEVRVPIDKIVVAEDCNGKVRTSELYVVREVPMEEWYD